MKLLRTRYPQDQELTDRMDTEAALTQQKLVEIEMNRR
jgi:hypothetical protein